MICVATAKRKTKKKLAGGVGDCKSPLGFFGDLVVCVCVCGRVCVCTPVAYRGIGGTAYGGVVWLGASGGWWH